MVYVHLDSVEALIGIIVAVGYLATVFVVARTIEDKKLKNKVYSDFTKKEKKNYWGFLLFASICWLALLFGAVYLFGTGVFIYCGLSLVVIGLFFDTSIAHILHIDVKSKKRFK